MERQLQHLFPSDEAASPMLKMSYKRADQSTTLKLEGKITAPWAGELQRTWHELASDLPGKEVLIDLSGVTFVDAEGKALLEWMSKQGAELRPGNLMTRYIVDEILRDQKTPRRNGG